jgi:uncharacterized protein YggE
MRKLSALLFLTTVSAFAQLDDNTITITATRQVTLQPDQIVFSVSVLAPQAAGLNDVLALLPGTGITGANLGEVYSNSPNALQWYFTLANSFSEASATVKLLTQLESQSKGAVSFYVRGMQVSQALQQSQPCSQAALVADGRNQAQMLASAAGLTVGPVLAVSDGSGIRSAMPTAVRGYVFAGTFVSLISTPLPTTPTTCTAVVKFQLYSYH